MRKKVIFNDVINILPDVIEDKQQKVNINIKNLFTGNQDDDNTIELDSNEDSSS